MTTSINVPYFDRIQTFYVDSQAVAGATQINLTSVDLFFKSKPSATVNTSGIINPGVSLWLCEVMNNQPVFTSMLDNSMVRVEYPSIQALSDASLPTIFPFAAPITVATDKFYAMVVVFDDPGFDLWVNKTGDTLIGTSMASPGTTNVHQGSYYQGNHTSNLINVAGSTAKFTVYAAQYQANSATVDVVNKKYEWFNITNLPGPNAGFIGGEFCWDHNTANASGTVAVSTGNSTIIGTGTSFNSAQEGTHIVYANNTGGWAIAQIAHVSNSTVITVANTPSFSNTSTTFKLPPAGVVEHFSYIGSQLHLVDSTAANATFLWAANSIVMGEHSGATATVANVYSLAIDKAEPYVPVKAIPSQRVEYNHSLAYLSGNTSYTMTPYIPFNMGSNEPGIPVPRDSISGITSNYNCKILSRSVEVTQPLLYGPDRLTSSHIAITLADPSTSTGSYTSPVVGAGSIDLVVNQLEISNTYTVVGNNSIVYDTEIEPGSGVAICKYISNKVTFVAGRFAESVIVYLNAFRPVGTDIKVYCKLHNSSDSDSFDSKAWTPLPITVNGDQYSNPTDSNNVIQYTCTLPLYSDTANTLPGAFTTQLSNNVIVASGVTANAYVQPNDVIKIYNPIAPTADYMVAVVTAANSSTITIGDSVSNNSVVGTGFIVDKLKYPAIAFTNTLNNNIVRYFNNSQVEFDTYDAMQLKIVLLADSTNVTPEVAMYQMIGVSA